MNAELKQMDWGFIARWLVITTFTFLVATALAFTSMWSIVGPLLESLPAPVAALLSGVWVGALIGLGLGVGQALALHGRGVSSVRWALLSAAGGAAGFALFSVLTAEGQTQKDTVALLAGGLAGLGIGLAQWSLLRHRLPNAAAWILVTTVAFLPMAFLAYNGSEVSAGLVMLAMGLAVAGITGVGAMWLFGRQRLAVLAQLVVLLALGLLAGCGGANEPAVRFAEPRAGANVASPVRVVMAAENFTVEPAGDGTVHEGAGHLHIMVDTPCIAAGNTIPKDETHLHFGDGSTETQLDLAPGEHTLCLQAADGSHTALPGEGMTHSITVTVP